MWPPREASAVQPLDNRGLLGSAGPSLPGRPPECSSRLLADAAAILLDEQNKRPCRKFLLTGKVPCSVQVPPCSKCLVFTHGFPQKPLYCGSDSKESICNAGDPGSTPGSGRSPGSLASQRHPGKFPQVPGRRRGKRGFPAAPRGRPRESLFNVSRGPSPLP